MSEPAIDDPPPNEGLWVRSEVTIDGTYVLTVEMHEDISFVLDAEADEAGHLRCLLDALRDSGGSFELSGFAADHFVARTALRRALQRSEAGL